MDTGTEDAENALEEDDEEWGGMDVDMKDQSMGEGHQPGTKPKKPPTGEELRTIKDATELFRSSSFKLQVRSDYYFLGMSMLTSSNIDRCLVTQCPTKNVQNTPFGSFPTLITLFSSRSSCGCPPTPLRGCTPTTQEKHIRPILFAPPIRRYELESGF